MKELKKAHELDPHSGMVHIYIGILFLQQESYSEAIESFKKALEVTGGTMPWAAELIGCAYASQGKRDRAEKILRESEAQLKRKYIPLTALMYLCAALGEDDKAFEWLGKACEQRDSLLPFLKFGPRIGPVAPGPSFPGFPSPH